MKKLKSKWVTKTPSTRLYQIPVPIIGLTGGIATGKTTVAHYFRNAGVPVIDADKLVKTIYQKKESFDFIQQHFPSAISGDGIDFKTLRQLAFATAENQTQLENFIYAQLPSAFTEAYSGLQAHEFIVYDVPLLFEKKLNEKIDVSVCVYTPRSIQLNRLIKRDHIAIDLAEKILSKQMDIEEKKNKSDLFVENAGSLEDLKTNFDKLLSNLLANGLN